MKKSFVILALLGIAPLAAAQGRGPNPMAAFDQIDADGNGAITLAEFEAHREARFAAADADGDGKLTPEELLASDGAERRMERRMTRMMARADDNGDGALSLDEMPGARAERLFSRLDKDGDGSISKAEAEAAGARMRKGRGERAAERNGG